MASKVFFVLMAFSKDPLLAFRKAIFLSQNCKRLVMVDKFLLEFFEPILSYFARRMHDLMLQSHKKYSLNSKYLTFDCKVFIDRFLVKDSKEFQ